VAGAGNEVADGPRRTAGAVLNHYVTAQVDAIVAGHFAIHQDAPDSVHQTRVACRRLRSALRTFAACYDDAAARTLGAELQWYAGVLGAVRDLEVMRQRLADHLADLPAKSVVGQVTEQIETRLARRQHGARADILDAHTGTRYAALLDRLVDWRDDPPFTAAAGRPAATLAKSVRHADKVLIKRLKRATSAHGDDLEMHSARKAGKRARYADEVVPTGRSVKHDKRLQDLLGEFQDSIVATEVIDWLAREARENGEDTFTYGVLFAAEHDRADRARRRARGWARKS
jgi:CHAD domain-containing protein